MTRQESESRVVPEGRVTPLPSLDIERRGGGKATPVSEQAQQLLLPFVTAESPSASGASREVPKTKVIPEPSTPATMERIAWLLRPAFANVAANKGAPGPDRRTIAFVREHEDRLLDELQTELLNGTYRPGAIRRVWIPKAGGGQRGLGIPNVLDRVVQEAVRLELEKLYEPTFHASSHGFRPDRSCHTAIEEARVHLAEGYQWVVDIDLESFFDRVCHQRLLARLSGRVKDRRVLVLIRRMLKAGIVMPDGVLVNTEEGVPQGGPLSPLLSNIVLDELDRELEQRGHRFVRYADDCNIYVRTERAGQRVMAGLKRFIEKRLRLRVNETKSAVARPEERHFLGFRLCPQDAGGPVEVKLSKRSLQRAMDRIRELTPRNWGGSLEGCIDKVSAYLKGWFGFFGICREAEERSFGGLDAHIRRRLRAIQLKQWKRKRTIARKLIKLGVRPRTAWHRIYQGRQGWWRLSHNPAVHRGLRNAYFAERGLVSLLGLLRAQPEPHRAPGQYLLWE